jgi:hypothetical protein
MSWPSHWRCGVGSSRVLPRKTGGDQIIMSSDRRARMMLCCAMDGGDPVVADLVQNLGAEGAWAKITEGGLGEPAAARAARVSISVVERLAKAAAMRFVIPSDEEVTRQPRSSPSSRSSRTRPTGTARWGSPRSSSTTLRQHVQPRGIRRNLRPPAHTGAGQLGVGLWPDRQLEAGATRRRRSTTTWTTGHHCCSSWAAKTT